MRMKYICMEHHAVYNKALTIYGIYHIDYSSSDTVLNINT